MSCEGKDDLSQRSPEELRRHLEYHERGISSSNATSMIGIASTGVGIGSSWGGYPVAHHIERAEV